MWWHGLGVLHGWAWYDTAWCVTAYCGLEFFTAGFYLMLRHGMAWCSSQSGMPLHSMAWHGTARHGTAYMVAFRGVAMREHYYGV
jgi:hypothetical protein